MLPSQVQTQDNFNIYFFPIYALLVFIGAIPSNLTSARYVSLAGSLVIIIMGFVLIFQYSDYREFNIDRGAEFKVFDLNLNIFSGYCLTLFSTVNQFAVVSILSEYKNPTRRRINKVT